MSEYVSNRDRVLEQGKNIPGLHSLLDRHSCYSCEYGHVLEGMVCLKHDVVFDMSYTELLLAAWTSSLFICDDYKCRKTFKPYVPKED